MASLEECKADAVEMLALAILTGDQFLIVACKEYRHCLDEEDLEAATNVNKVILIYTAEKLEKLRPTTEGTTDETEPS